MQAKSVSLALGSMLILTALLAASFAGSSQGTIEDTETDTLCRADKVSAYAFARERNDGQAHIIVRITFTGAPSGYLELEDWDDVKTSERLTMEGVFTSVQAYAFAENSDDFREESCAWGPDVTD